MYDDETPIQQLPAKSPDTSMFKNVIRQLRLIWRLFKDGRVPIWMKAVPFASLVYLLFPADVVPDVLLGLGQLDDMAVIALGLKLFTELAPPGVVQEHMDELMAEAHQWQVIDGEAEILDDPES